MFVRITKSGPRQYVKLVEAFRDDGGVSRHRVIATLGRLETVQAGATDALLNGLLKAAGHATLEQGSGEICFAPALSVGDTWLLTALWKQLGFDRAFRCILGDCPQLDMERLLRVMVFNRLCEPESKQGIAQWLESTLVPEVAADSVTPPHLQQTLDTLGNRQEAMTSALSALLRPLLDQDLSVVFYDLTAVRAEGLGATHGEPPPAEPAAKEVSPSQAVLAVAQTETGLPISHEVLSSNTGEDTALQATIKRMLQRFPGRQVVLVANQDLLSLDNLVTLQGLSSNGHPLQFILAVPARRSGEFEAVLKEIQHRYGEAQQEAGSGTRRHELRLIVAPHTEQQEAQEEKQSVLAPIVEMDASQWAATLNEHKALRLYQDDTYTGSHITAQFYRAVCDAQLAHALKMDLITTDFCPDKGKDPTHRMRLLDGKLLLLTNLPKSRYRPADIVRHYRALTDIERSFRMPKPEIEMAQLFRRLPEHIRSYALMCFLALVLHRVLRLRLRTAGSPYSPERALEIVRRIQHHRITLHRQQRASGLTALSQEQKALFALLGLPEPNAEIL